jgi:hypothetical protein
MAIERGPALRVMVIFPVRANALLTANDEMLGVRGVFRGIVGSFLASQWAGDSGQGCVETAVSGDFGGNKMAAGPSYQR